MGKYRGRIALLLIVCMAFSVMLAACSGEENSQKDLENLEQLHGKVIGYTVGVSYIDDVNKRYPDSEKKLYNVPTDAIEALKSGRIDAYITDDSSARFTLKETEGLKTLDGFITKDRYGFILNQENTPLCKEVNGVLEKFRQDGTLKKLESKWVDNYETAVLEPVKAPDAPKGVMKIGSVNDWPPFAYYQDGGVVGYDVELVSLIARELGYEPEFTVYNFDSLISAIAADRADIAVGCITYTPERAESVLFTDEVYGGGTVAVVLDHSGGTGGFWEGIKTSFRKTLIQEDRWKLLANGLLVTVELSLLSLVFGTLLGFLYSFPLRSKNKLVRKTASLFSAVLDGLPLLVVLMVLFYIVFAKTQLSALVIGVIGFTLDFANNVAGILNTGIDAVNKGEIEAAESMGYSKFQIFMKITFPQAVNHMFSQYGGAVVSLIKGTSIIGYITVEDLTKAGDIIRSRTYEAFFPLILTALIYLLIARVFIALLSAMAKRLDPKHRKRCVKGVVVHD